MASDIGDRIEELRAVLGVTQGELANRAGVYPAQVSNWIGGKQRPPKKRLETWAQQEKWSVSMFAEGGPRPREVNLTGAALAGDARKTITLKGALSERGSGRLQVMANAGKRVVDAGKFVPIQLVLEILEEITLAWAADLNAATAIDAEEDDRAVEEGEDDADQSPREDRQAGDD